MRRLMRFESVTVPQASLIDITPKPDISTGHHNPMNKPLCI